MLLNLLDGVECLAVGIDQQDLERRQRVFAHPVGLAKAFLVVGNGLQGNASVATFGLSGLQLIFSTSVWTVPTERPSFLAAMEVPQNSRRDMFGLLY